MRKKRCFNRFQQVLQQVNRDTQRNTHVYTLKRHECTMCARDTNSVAHSGSICQRKSTCASTNCAYAHSFPPSMRGWDRTELCNTHEGYFCDRSSTSFHTFRATWKSLVTHAGPSVQAVWFPKFTADILV